MTLKEFAHIKAEELKNRPFKRTIIDVVNSINSATCNGVPLTQSQISIILEYMDDELKGYSVVSETFDNSATLSLMAEVHKLMAQTSGGKK